MECISELKDSLNVYFGCNNEQKPIKIKIEQINPHWIDLGIGLF